MTTTIRRGTPSFAAGKFGNAMSGAVYWDTGVLNGITGAAGANIITNLTVECWVKASSTSGNRVAVGKDGLFWVGHNANGQPTVSFGGSGTGAVTQVLSHATDIRNDGAWHHIAMVVDAGIVKLYVDGALRATSGSATGKFGDTAQLDGISIGGFQAAAGTFDFVGAIDEVSICAAVKYSGSSYSVPSAAFPASRPGQVALYHLDAGGDNADGADTNPPTIGTITLTHSGSTDTISYPAPAAGSAAVTAVRLYEGTASGAQSGTPVATNTGAGAGSFGRPSATSGAKFYVVRVIDADGVLSDASNEVAYPPARVHKPSDGGYVFSPGNWHIDSDRAFTNCGGAYLRTLIIGSMTSFEVRLDASAAPAAGKRSIVSYRVDQGAWVDAEISGSGVVTVSIPTETLSLDKHIFEMVMKTSTTTLDRWNSPYVTALKFLGLFLPAGAYLQAPPTRRLRGMVFGDSISEGISTRGSSGDETVRSDGKLSYAFTLTSALGSEVGIVGYGGAGIARPAGAGTGQVPPLATTWDEYANGLPRILPGDLDFVLINIGTNDARNGVSVASYKAALTGLLNDLAAVLPTRTKIIAMRPFGGYYAASDYRAAIAATTSPRRHGFIDTEGWWSTADAFDGLHPAAAISVSELGPRVAAAVRDIINASGQYVNVGGAAVRVNAQRR